MGVFGEISKLGSKVVGEMSRLRSKVFGIRMFGSYSGTYKLDTSTVDYKMARELYNNTDDNYKLGAWAAKPVINTCVGFMGVPSFRVEDEEAQEVLNAFHSENVSAFQQTHRDTLRDGDCWVWLTREEDEENKVLYPETDGFRLVYNIIPPEMIDHSQTRRNPITGKIEEYVFRGEHTWIDENGMSHRCVIVERIDKHRRKREIIGDRPPGVEPMEQENMWGFIPIVQFSNEKDVSAANGRSDLEAIEPFMKAYHDVMLQSIKGSKLHSTPKLGLYLKDVGSFLRNNFGIVDPAKFAQEGGKIKIDDKEVLLFEGDDKGEFIEVRSSTGDAQVLLKFLFFCIVDASETPEFAFGVHTPSSQASVKEQMPVLVRRVMRKREHFTSSWERLARMVLAMHSISTGKKFKTHAVKLLWDEIDPRDDESVARALLNFVQALAVAVDHQLISQESAVNFLAGYVDTMSDYVGDDKEIMGEREKIIRDRIRMARLEDGPLMEEEQKLIDQVLKEMRKTG